MKRQKIPSSMSKWKVKEISKKSKVWQLEQEKKNQQIESLLDKFQKKFFIVKSDGQKEYIC